MRFNFNEESLFLQILHNGFSSFVSVHSGIFARIFVHCTVIVEDFYYRQRMSLTYFKVVGIVSGGDFNNACSELHIDVFISDYGYFFVYERKNYGFADKIFISFVIRVNRKSCIAEHCFGTRGCYCNKAVAVRDRVFDVPEKSGIFLIFNLCVRKCGITFTAPVGYSFASVNKSLVVERDKNVLYGFVAALVHCKALSCPIQRRTEHTELFCDSAAVFVFPFPRSFKKFFSAEIVF